MHPTALSPPRCATNSRARRSRAVLADPNGLLGWPKVTEAARRDDSAFESLAAAFGISTATVAAELDPFRDGLGFVAPGFEACEQYNYGIRAFAQAASFQGEFPGTVELHHR